MTTKPNAAQPLPDTADTVPAVSKPAPVMEERRASAAPTQEELPEEPQIYTLDYGLTDSDLWDAVVMKEDYDELRSHCSRLSVRLGEAEKDAERYRRLRAKATEK